MKAASSVKQGRGRVGAGAQGRMQGQGAWALTCGRAERADIKRDANVWGRARK